MVHLQVQGFSRRPEILMRALQENTSVVELDLSDYGLGDSGACLRARARVCAFVLSRIAFCLRLPVRTSAPRSTLATGALLLAMVIRYNTTIQSICFDSNGILMNGYMSFRDALRKNNHIKYVGYPYKVGQPSILCVGARACGCVCVRVWAIRTRSISLLSCVGACARVRACACLCGYPYKVGQPSVLCWGACVRVCVCLGVR